MGDTATCRGRLKRGGGGSSGKEGSSQKGGWDLPLYGHRHVGWGGVGGGGCASHFFVMGILNLCIAIGVISLIAGS